ncbi:MAG TPA: SUMF1/EgtB/PvdO family nonheme iron enzyme [Thermoanaerobaculia bacterium]|nr:SUMF1/EgtB/PvdO family nonheme iron enzyme [Thermoanaerobaculia bacterium]
MSEEPKSSARAVQLEATIEAIRANLGGKVPAAVLDEALRPHLEERAALLGLADHQSAVAQIGSAAATSGGFAAQAQTINFILVSQGVWARTDTPAPAINLVEVTARYLEVLFELFCYLDFRGMGVDDSVPLQLALLDTYVPLSARPCLPEGETWDRSARLAGRGETAEELEALRPGQPQHLLELLRAHDGLVVLGDPGSGKSTFLKFLALMLATGREEELGLGPRVPFLLPISAFAEELGRGTCPLEDCLVRHYQSRGLGQDLGALVTAALAEGRALVLLDGLDEVKDPDRRLEVANRVKDFYVRHRGAGNRLVLTSRVVGWAEIRLTGEKLGECTLVDFGDEDLELFATQWTGAIERKAQAGKALAQYAAERERTELLEAIHGNPAVRKLAGNPLLLTILALMKRQRVVLPDRRAQLYDLYVKVLLSHWNRNRSLSGRAGVSLDVEATLKVLAPLALWMQRTVPGAGLVKAALLEQELEAIFAQDPRLLSAKGLPAREAARSFLRDVRDHTGLLLARGAGHFGFPHLTFQEYLAAVGLVEAGQEDLPGLLEALAEHVGEPAWREVILLTLEHLALNVGRDRAASQLIEGLIAGAPGPAGEAVLLAGQAILEVGPLAVTPECRQRTVEALLGTLTAETGPPALVRCKAGRQLVRLGDPREGVRTLDGMELCWVPEGPFWMGSPADDSWAYDDEKPLHEQEIPYGYWLGRWPVTVWQWREYVEARGVEPGDKDSLDGDGNEPVVWVSWREARAFCGWLGKRWRQAGLLPAGWEVRLPSEREWEKAARGGRAVPVLEEPPSRAARAGLAPPSRLALVENPLPHRRFPWGDDADPERANYGESGVGRPSAAGAFATGASLYGCQDLAGNVLEWTGSLWGEVWKQPTYGHYPYDPDDGRESADASEDILRVLRGGAFRFVPQSVQCAARGAFHPWARYYNVGFRVLASPFSSGL